MAAQLLLHPSTIAQLRLSSFRAELLGRTLLYNSAAALLAILMAIPAALAIGRSRAWPARLLLALLPISLLYPSIAYTYGWSHVFLLVGITFKPAAASDVLRCIWTLACWLWALPAIGIGLALRHLDPQLQQHALLDGGLWRITARLLAGPAFACFAATFVLAIQEFAVYEPSGISVMATEIRTVFETGVPGSTPQAIIDVSPGASTGIPNQSHRAAAAVATSIPLLAIILLLLLIAARGLKGYTAADASTWPPALDAGKTPILIAYLLLAITLLTPTVAMILSLSQATSVWKLWRAANHHLAGSISYGLVTGALALALAFLATTRRSRFLFACSIATFLIGGQLLAIADIRIYNRPTFLGIPFEWIYNGPLVIIIAYLGRFAWLALFAAQGSWSRPFVELRELAALDGAGPLRTASLVVWPLLWPTLVGSSVLVLILSLSELPATVLLVPLIPPALTTLLVTWVHQLRYDAMLVASLMLICATTLLAIVLVVLVAIGARLARWTVQPPSASNQ